MQVSAFIPIKKYSHSKGRLASILSEQQRSDLSKAMAAQTIKALTHSNICDSITLVTNDSDLIIEHNQFISGIKALEKYDMVSPYSKVIDLTPQESSQPTNNILTIDRDGRGENDNQKINISGGVAMFKKESIIKIGGWNEDFIGWGAEDDEITIRVKKL